VRIFVYAEFLSTKILNLKANYLNNSLCVRAVIDTVKGVTKYNGKEKKLNYDNGHILIQLFLTEENTILPLKEFILKQGRKL